MNPATAEWVTFAESDFGVATREHALLSGPNPPAVCFHSQQCVEKLLKAALVERGQSFPKSHDLTMLSGLVAACIPAWAPAQSDLDILEPGSVAYRYPGAKPSVQDATDALAACTRLRASLLAII